MQISKTRMKELDEIVKKLQSKEFSSALLMDSEEHSMLHKYEVCDSLLKKYGSIPKVVKMMTNDSRFMSVTPTRCRQIIYETMYIYGTGSQIVADYYFNILLEKSFELMPKMIAAGDYKAFNGAISNIHKILEHFKASEAVNKDLLKQQEFTLVVNINEKAHKIPLNKMMELNDEERISILDSLKSEILTPDMIEFLQKEDEL